MNKKGLDYAALLLLIVIIGLVIIFVQVQTKFNKVSSIGVHQSEILNVNNKALIFDKYLKEASNSAFDRALFDVINAKPQYVRESFAGGDYDLDTSLCTTPNFVKEFEPELTKKFNEHIRGSMASLFFEVSVPRDEQGVKVLDNFLIGQEGSEITVSAIKPIKLQFTNAKGYASYRPVITIDGSGKLKEYTNWIDTISTISKACNNSEDPIECSKTFTEIYEWEILKYSDLKKQEIPPLPWEQLKEKKPPTPSEQNTYLILITTLKSSWGDQKICFKIELEQKAQEKTQTSQI